MMDAGRHPRIELLVDSEVEDITGFVGNYRALVRRRARFVDSDECTSCAGSRRVVAAESPTRLAVSAVGDKLRLCPAHPVT